MSRKSRSRSSSSESLVCPACARRYGLDERFCEQCRMPLVYAGRESAEEPVSEAHERARKIRPEYTRGELGKVAWGRNQAEAELIQNILLEEGVPSVLRRSRGFDVPDFLAAGPRDVMVAESGAQAARQALRQAEIELPDETGDAPLGSRALRILAGLVVVGFFGLLLAWLLFQVSA